MKKLTLMAFCLVAALSSSAYDFEKDGFYYNITSLSDLTVEIAQPDNGGYSGDITIPESVEYSSYTFSVTGINKGAFADCNIGTLSIKDNIKRMGHMYWGTINNFRLEDSDTPLELDEGINGWWWYSEGVTNVYIGRNIMSYSVRLFEESRVKTATFGSKVTTIPRELFSGCSALTTVEVPETVEAIGDYAFVDTSIESFKALGAKTIGTGTFSSCEKLTSVEFSGLLTTIEGYAFHNCSALTKFILPENSYGLHVIDYNSFEGCTALETFTIPEGVIEIGSYAFENCTALKEIKVPATVLDFGNIYKEYDNQRGNVFKGCSALTTITMGDITPVASIENNFDFTTYLSATLKVPVGAAEAYRSADVWKNFADIREDAGIADDIFALKVSNNYKGTIEINATEATESYSSNSYISYRFIKKGEPVEIIAKPNNGYKLTNLMINGVDVIDDVVDNVYHTTMTGSMDVLALFDDDYTPQPDPEPIFLTIKQADNGSIRQRVEKWDSFTFYVEPADGWQLHTVTFDGRDITSEVETDGRLRIYDIVDNAVLSVVFEQENSAVNDVQSSRARVYGCEGTITVANAERGETIQIYNEAGMNVATRQAASGTENINVEKGHVYIVKLRGKTVKLNI